VLLFQMNGGIKQANGEETEGLTFDPTFFWALAKALLTGDALNVLGYRIRPYELEEGATDRAMEQAKKLVYDALHDRTSFVRALWRARKVMRSVAVDKTRVKPKVGITGEFWAMTTEGDGSYHMQRFLQSEGAEVDTPIVTAWVLFMVWEVMRDTKYRMTLRTDDAGRKGLSGVDVRKRLMSVWAADKALRVIFGTIAKVLGLKGYKLPKVDEVAEVAKDFYNHDLRGGESYLEVGKVIMNVVKQKVNMTLSIKPFGCMPSSGVSDGVQSAIAELYPDAIFLPVETTGDGAVNVQSRVQMMLFKARQNAEREVQDVLDGYGMTMEQVQRMLRVVPGLTGALYHPPHRHGSTAADMVERAGALRHPLRGIGRWLDHHRNRRAYKAARHVAIT
jgi:predicted nucleotide-binding protein (sugar kinase/HSP70/actin superfamily)